KRGVRSDASDAVEVHRRQRRAGIEPVPAEPQDDCADRADREVVWRQGTAAVPLEHPSQTGAERYRTGERDESADRVYHRRSGEVAEDGTVREAVEELRRHVAQPAAWSPGPVAEDRVDEAGHRRR